MHKYWCVLVSEQIYLDHCFEFGCTGQRDVAAEKYSGGCILFFTERQVVAVIVGFLTSASQVYLAFRFDFDYCCKYFLSCILFYF